MFCRVLLFPFDGFGQTGDLVPTFNLPEAFLAVEDDRCKPSSPG
jgi:hypothetical protein